MLFCTDIDLTEQALSSLDRDVYEIFIFGIWRIHPSFQLQFGRYEAESEHFRWDQENAISTSGFPET